jgi:hypothetical protein
MQKLMGASYLLPPIENPYGFASTFISAVGNGTASESYSRGNSFIYAVQGSDKSRRHIVDLPGACKKGESNKDKRFAMTEIMRTFQTSTMASFSKICVDLKLPRIVEPTSKFSLPILQTKELSAVDLPEDASSCIGLKNTVFHSSSSAVLSNENAYLTPPTSFPSVDDASSDEEDQSGKLSIHHPIVSDFPLTCFYDTESTSKGKEETFTGTNLLAPVVPDTSSAKETSALLTDDGVKREEEILVINNITSIDVHSTAEYCRNRQEVVVVLSGIASDVMHSLDVQVTLVFLIRQL